MGMLAAALQRGNAGAAQFQDIVSAEHFQEGVDLFRAAGQFKHHRVRRKINDLGFIDRSDFPHFGTLGGIAGHFQQQQFPLQALIRGQFKYLAGHFQPLGL